MDDILKLAKDYSKKRHLDLLPHGNNNILENLDASRCNNSHGNVAARMNSINANKDTFKMYTDIVPIRPVLKNVSFVDRELSLQISCLQPFYGVVIVL